MIDANLGTGALPYRADLLEEIVRFQREAYPLRRPDWIEPRWLWMYVESATRLGLAPMVWIYRRPTGVVAHQGVIPVRLKVGEKEIATAWFVETMALESVRGKAVGPMLVAKALREVPLNLSLGQTEHMRQLQYRLGWHRVATMDSWLLVLDARRAFKGRVQRPAFRAAIATAAWSWHRALRIWTPRTSARTGFESRLVDHFGPEHDELWRQLRDQYRCAVVRDASYLNWKYVAQPGQRFRRIELREAGKVCGICVLAIHESDRTHAYRRGWIVDFVAPHARFGTVAALLSAVTRYAASLNVAVLEFDLLGVQLGRHLRRFGFIRGAPTRQLLVADGGADAETSTTLRSPQAWYATRADSDGDHPWWTPTGRMELGQATSDTPDA